VLLYADIDTVPPEVDNRGVRMPGVSARPDDQRGPPVHLPDRGGHPAVLVLLGDEGVEVAQSALVGGAVHQDLDLALVEDKGYLTFFTRNVTTRRDERLLATRGHWDQFAALHQIALTAARRAEDRLGEAGMLAGLGTFQVYTGDYPAAAASMARALALFGDLGDLPGEAHALNQMGLLRVVTGDYPAAAASYQQALALFGDLGNLLGQAEAHNNLGQLATRTAETPQARGHHAQALAIARDLSAPLEEARALEGLGQSHLQDGNPGQATAHLLQALTIYQRIGAPAARRVQQALDDHRLTSTTPEPESAAPNSEGHQPRTPTAPQQAVRQAAVLGTRAKPGVPQNSLICIGIPRPAPSNCERT